ncbi:hypothetical protein BpHYR1_050617, partial [Brachionus plicatilis]
LKVKYNENSWTMSSCNWWYWLKNYKCYHITTIAARKKKCSLDSVGMDFPIQANRKRGQPKGTAGALEHQPKETQSSNLAPKCIDSDTDDASNPIEENVSKRPIIVSNIQAEEKLCDKCGAKMIKRR